MNKNHKGIYLQLHVVNDLQILQKLQEVKNKQGYIKNLIINDDSLYKNFIKGVEHDKS